MPEANEKNSVDLSKSITANNKSSFIDNPTDILVALLPLHYYPWGRHLSPCIGKQGCDHSYIGSNQFAPLESMEVSSNILHHSPVSELDPKLIDTKPLLSCSSDDHPEYSYVPLQKLEKNVMVLEYLKELDWLSNQLSRLDLINISNSNLKQSKSLYKTKQPNCSRLLTRHRFHYMDRQTAQSPRLPTVRQLFCFPKSSNDKLVNETQTTLIRPPLHSVILIPSMSLYQRERGSRSLSSSFDAFSPHSLQRALFEGRVPRSSRALLSVCRPIKKRYGEFPFDAPNINLLLDSCVLNKPSLSETGITHKGTTPTITDTSEKKKIKQLLDSRAVEEYTKPISTTTHKLTHSSYYSLFLDPMEPFTVSALMNQLKSPSCKRGVPSPVSPVIQEQQQLPSTTSINTQPYHSRRNRSRLCPFHKTQSTLPHMVPLSQNGTDRITGGSWVWDKEEPLCTPSLCSCHNEQLYRLWNKELQFHTTLCFPQLQTLTELSLPNIPLKDSSSNDLEHITSSTISGLDTIDWTGIEKGDFSSFLTDIGPLTETGRPIKFSISTSPSYQTLHSLRFCPSCGGLPYVPFSFVEIALNRDIPTLHDLARKVPLPIPTELYCDGLRITACFVARSRLHEWLIMKVLMFCDLHHTAKTYQICSNFIYPFHKLQERPPSTQVTPITQLQSDISCARHNLLYNQVPPNYTITDPPKFTLPQHRRPYCLRRRLPISDEEITLNGPVAFNIDILRVSCWNWLHTQQGPNISTPSPPSALPRTPTSATDPTPLHFEGSVESQQTLKVPCVPKKENLE